MSDENRNNSVSDANDIYKNLDLDFENQEQTIYEPDEEVPLSEEDGGINIADSSVKIKTNKKSSISRFTD